jgi:hypothetical protein
MEHSDFREPPVEHVLCQMLIAFGQGTGGMHVSLELIDTVWKRYTRPVTRRLAEWESLAPETLEYARGLGRLAAVLALQDGRNVIAGRDLEEADRRFRKNEFAFFQRCPYCPAGKWLEE